MKEIAQFKENYEQAIEPYASFLAMSDNPLNERGGGAAAHQTTGDNESHPLMGNSLLTRQKRALDEQEEQLDEIFGVTKAIKYEGRNIDAELKTQAPIIDKVRDEMDKNQMKVMKIDNKLKTLVAGTNVCMLTLIIFVEFLILFFLVFVF